MLSKLWDIPGLKKKLCSKFQDISNVFFFQKISNSMLFPLTFQIPGSVIIVYKLCSLILFKNTTVSLNQVLYHHL